MKTRISILFFLIFSLSFVACQKDDVIDDKDDFGNAKRINLPTYATKVLKSGNAFGINLFKDVAKDEEKNLMLSPLSANIALNMAMNGADGATFEQMRDMLGYKNLTQQQINDLYQTLIDQLLKADSKVTFNLANAIFYKNNFIIKPNYIDVMNKVYQADIENLNFADVEKSLATINGWATEKTNDKITKVLNNISPNAVMFLLNAVYFKGNWTQQFNKESTQDMSFKLKDNTNITVPTMMSKIKIRADIQDDFSTYELSYGRDNFVMDLILPKTKLSTFIENFNNDDYAEVTSRLNDQEKTEYDVLLPKFSFEYEKRLNKTLKSLGMVDAFSDSNADFSKLSDVFTHISFVKQNSFIDVNEEGTEAAAVTTIGIKTNSVGEKPTPMVHFNKPFVYMIRERTTNTLLFIGTVYNPLEKE